MQKAVAQEGLPLNAKRGDRLRDLVLARIACAQGGIAKAAIAADLAPLASDQPGAKWRSGIDHEIDQLAAAGFVGGSAAKRQASAAGKARAGKVLGVKGDLAGTWPGIRDGHLVAIALGLRNAPAGRIKALATLDGLRGAIVESAFNLKIKSVPTPARLREALAATALKRAFGDKSTEGLAGKLGLSAKAGRLLAAQLSQKPRDFGTDTRLVAALAAEHLGTDANDVEALRLVVLRRYFGAGTAGAAPAKRPARRALGKGAPPATRTPAPAPSIAAVPVMPKAPVATPTAPLPPPGPAPQLQPMIAPPAGGRPDLPGFASEVRRHAATSAQGWSGDRKAYISHVWRNIRDKRPEWGLSEIEFKCMLAEAHRAGSLMLANADLKDKDNIKDVQDSAVSFRNTVFHFIRVDA